MFHDARLAFQTDSLWLWREDGMSTQTMPPRRPVGLEGLVTYRYELVGHRHVVASYSGAAAKAFTHGICYRLAVVRPTAPDAVVSRCIS